MAWMATAAAVAVTAGVLACSVALTGFRLDSVIKLFAAAVVVWQPPVSFNPGRGSSTCIGQIQ